MDNLNILTFAGKLGDSENPVQQGYEKSCAIKSQQLILNDFGIDVSEDQLVQYSMEKGWFDGTGTMPEDVGKLLADAGIPCTQSVNANIYDLMSHLSHGHKVIVAVDSGELWNGGLMDWYKDMYVGDTPDHALIVAGIDMSDPENPMVILTDPGTGEAAAPYPLDQFMDAWADSQNFMVSTDIPTPDVMDAFASAGLTDNHLTDIAGVDYNSFMDFQQYSHLIDPMQLPDLNMAFNDFAMLPDPTFELALTPYDLYDPALYSMMEMPVFYDPFAFDYTALQTPWFDPYFEPFV